MAGSCSSASLPYPSSNLALCSCSTRYAFPPFKPIKSLIIIPSKFAESQVAPKAKLPQFIQAVISSLASPESEMTANTLVLVAHGISGDLRRLDEMKISEFSPFTALSFSPSPSCTFPFFHLSLPFPLLPPPRSPFSSLSLPFSLLPLPPSPSRPLPLHFSSSFFFSDSFAFLNSIPSTFPL